MAQKLKTLVFMRQQFDKNIYTLKAVKYPITVKRFPIQQGYYSK